uniref:Gag polyprotein n=1 Tax=Catagonus wagneri TaxID=51154 RepID=A0A8C3XDW3_9CETA
MGQSVTTPLSLTLQHWKDVRNTASNQSVDIRKKKWIALCSSEWPTFDVGWPQEGAFNLNIILQVKAKIINPGPRDHSDQVAYIVTWEALVNDPPPWVKPFITSECPPLTLSSPSSAPSAPFLPPLAPTTSSLYPALIEDTHSVLPPSQDLLIDLLSDEPPPYQGSEPGQPGEAEVTTKGPAKGSPVPEKPAPSPVAGRLRGRREPPPDSTSHAFPLRAGLNGQPQYWPFSASDLYNWKNNNPPFSKDPSMLTSLIESILVTHQPTWDDCQQLLQALLTSEEKQRVLLEARKNVPGENGRPTQMNHLRLYRQLLIAGLRGAARRPTNLAQVKQITQGSEETPSAFLERLKEAYRMYTPYDPEDPGQATNVSMSFIWQSAPDIRKKLERLDNLRENTWDIPERGPSNM